MSRGSTTRRVLLSLATVVVGLVVLLRLLDGTFAATGTRPTLVADAPGPLFDGARLTPGSQREACLGVRPSGAPARGIAFGGASSGPLAGFVRLRVQRGVSNGIPGSCAGFVPVRDDYDGPLTGLAGGDLVVPNEPAPLADGARVAYRLTAELEPGAPDDAVAGADFRWAATFDDPTLPPTATGAVPAPPEVPTGGVDPREDDAVPTTMPPAGAGGAGTVVGADPAAGCVVSRRGPTVAVRRAGRTRVEVRTVGARYLPEGAALPVEVRVRGGGVPRVAVGRRPLAVSRRGGAWRAVLPATTTAGRVVGVTASARAGRRTVSARLATGLTRCGTTVDARHVGRRGLALRIDGQRPLRGVRIDLPRGLRRPVRGRPTALVFGVDARGRVFRRTGRATSRGGRLPAVRVLSDRVEVTEVPQGTSIVRLVLGYPAGRESALRRAACRARVAGWVATDAEVVRRGRALQRAGRRCR